MFLKISTLVSLMVLSSSAFANENLTKNCKYADMLNFAEKNSLIKQTTTDSIIFKGGPTHANLTSVTLAADLVSQGGLREISLISCNVFGKMKSLGGSIQQGNVYFKQKIATISVDPPLVSDLDPANPTISMTQANSTTNGFLTSSDWTRFNSSANRVEELILKLNEKLSGK